ncbi:hypothetical protein GQR58_015163 [Nymphon striatum]|nr:hypothetical protein GQR58_015163 [Nymphon striatum]
MSPSVKAMEELKSSVKKSMKNCWTTFLVNVEANLALSGKDIGNNVNLTLAQESDIQTDILPLTSPPRPLARHDVNNFKTMSTNTSICEHCSKPTTEKYVTEFCETVKDANMTDRCCWNSTALIGVKDSRTKMQNCSKPNPACFKYFFYTIISISLCCICKYNLVKNNLMHGRITAFFKKRDGQSDIWVRKFGETRFAIFFEIINALLNFLQKNLAFSLAILFILVLTNVMGPVQLRSNDWIPHNNAKAGVQTSFN